MRMALTHLVLCLVALALTFTGPGSGSTMASIQPEDDMAATDIRVLSDEDVRIYREIFAAQERIDWTLADRLARRLQNRILMGHVLFERYMHPTGYRSSYDELAGWMRKYADHPGAERIYRLAQLRRYRGGPTLAAPVPLDPIQAISTRRQYSTAEVESRRARLGTQNIITQHLRRGQPSHAEKRF